MVERKWAGIIWDSLLTFQPFLTSRLGAARAGFKPLLALALEGLAPLAEIREVIAAKVVSALMYICVHVSVPGGRCPRESE